MVIVHQYEYVVLEEQTWSIDLVKVIGDEEIFEKIPHVLILLDKLSVGLALAPIYLVMLHFHHVLACDLCEWVR